MRFIRRLFVLLVVLIVAAVLALWIGASLSLDYARQHTSDAANLPAFSPSADAAIVQMRVGKQTFRARVAGFDNPAIDRKNLILLHGFPETSIMWEPLITAAAAYGCRVIAFDQRGYSPGARPSGRSNYTTDQLVADVLAIADSAGFDTFHLVGHDWGAAVGWQTVLSHPERVTTWTALSIPHIAAFAQALQDDPEQQSKSAYMGFFWLPWLAEQVFAFNDLALMRDGMYQEHPPGHVAEYMKVFAEPGALTGALNWYRASPTPGSTALEVSTPTLFIWGNGDPAVGRVGVDAQRAFMIGPFSEIELDTGHWLMATEAQRVVSSILTHLNTSY